MAFDAVSGIAEFMMGAEKRLAVVVRGPPGTGKSTLLRRLLGRLGRNSCEAIVLDAGWGPGDFRFHPTRRYKDLLTDDVRNSRVVFVEIGCAEPIYGIGEGKYVLDLVPGATLNPKEWADILRLQNREIASFFLWADWGSLEKRIHADQNRALSLDFQKTVHSLYERPDFSRHFAYHADVEEHRIDVSGMSEDEVESAVLVHLSQRGFELRLADRIQELLPRLTIEEKKELREAIDRQEH